MRKLKIPFLLEQVSGASPVMGINQIRLRGSMFGIRVDRLRIWEAHRTTLHLDEALRQPGEQLRVQTCLGPRRRYPRLSYHGLPERQVCCAGSIFSLQGCRPYHATLEECSYALGMGKPIMDYLRLRNAIPPPFSTYTIAETIGQIMQDQLECPYITYDEALKDMGSAREKLRNWFAETLDKLRLQRALRRQWGKRRQ